jgi:hypothetical protein
VYASDRAHHQAEWAAALRAETLFGTHYPNLIGLSHHPRLVRRRRFEPSCSPSAILQVRRFLDLLGDEAQCGLALDESLLDDEMAGLGMVAFREAALFERLAQIFQHAGAAAQHDTVSLDVQRRQADVVE